MTNPAWRNGRQEILAIKAQHNLAERVAKKVKLKEKGGRWWGLCPFHKEKTPSFSVTRGQYYCHGCGESGDIFTWMNKVEGLKFSEALSILDPSSSTRAPTSKGRAWDFDQSVPTIEERIAWCEMSCPFPVFVSLLVMSFLPPSIAASAKITCKVDKVEGEATLAWICDAYGFRHDLEGKLNALLVWEKFSL